MRLRFVCAQLLSLLLLTALPAAAQDSKQPDPNVNLKYVIETAVIRWLPASERRRFDDDLQALAGRRADSDEVHAFETRLREALPEYVISRRTARGTEPGRIRLIFEVRKADWARWLRFEAQDLNLIYHSDQGWGSKLPLSISSGDVLISPIFAIDVGDELIEEYGGFGLRIESRRLGTERLGFLFDWSTYDQTWRNATVDALALNPGVPALYSNRMTVAPVLKFAITRQVSVDGGVRITELDPLEDGGESRMANAALFAVSFSERPRETTGPRQWVEGSFTVRAGLPSLESDFDYRRYFVQGRYTHGRGRQVIVLSGNAGRIEGEAPLFERFTLGDSRTLRGWDKYDIGPLGGSRVAYGSLEYRYRAFGTFVDAGSVWDQGGARKLRVSTGLTFHTGPVFMTVGFPVNTDELRAVFTMGVRFSTAGVSKY